MIMILNYNYFLIPIYFDIDKRFFNESNFYFLYNKKQTYN